ncbi:hypothetical protein [Agromyces sp. Leaf222]|uniref:hypothetical protein n=1 Tax=Agromyces sp. Leaf222 TaxID=1735688 RepID=UPI0006F5A5EB|nr:hypothetical protein [Agromyces sp. Leaf222]KQM82723.1 hypothetical protein ASE68_05135 [Agromyces sp. Leaf222]
MRRILDFRIVRWEFKVLYIAVAWIAGVVIVNALVALGVPPLILNLVNLLTLAVSFALAVRIFRGQDEPVDPPRAWWRMTAWPTLSRRLGVLFIVVAAMGVFSVAIQLAGVGEGTAAPRLDGAPALGTTIGGTIESALLAYLYLNSAMRMKRLGIAKPGRLPKPVRLT